MKCFKCDCAGNDCSLISCNLVGLRVWLQNGTNQSSIMDRTQAWSCTVSQISAVYLSSTERQRWLTWLWGDEGEGGFTVTAVAVGRTRGGEASRWATTQIVPVVSCKENKIWEKTKEWDRRGCAVLMDPVEQAVPPTLVPSRLSHSPTNHVLLSPAAPSAPFTIYVSVPLSSFKHWGSQWWTVADSFLYMNKKVQKKKKRESSGWENIVQDKFL